MKNTQYLKEFKKLTKQQFIKFPLKNCLQWFLKITNKIIKLECRNINEKKIIIFDILNADWPPVFNVLNDYNPKEKKLNAKKLSESSFFENKNLNAKKTNDIGSSFKSCGYLGVPSSKISHQLDLKTDLGVPSSKISHQLDLKTDLGFSSSKISDQLDLKTDLGFSSSKISHQLDLKTDLGFSSSKISHQLDLKTDLGVPKVILNDKRCTSYLFKIIFGRFHLPEEIIDYFKRTRFKKFLTFKF